MANASGTDDVTSTATTPFEWLTSPASLQPHILAALQARSSSSDDDEETSSSRRQRVLHVGCGSSILGELLVTNPLIYPSVQQVVNVDIDAEILQQMQERWRQRHPAQQCDNPHHSEEEDASKMLFETIDFTSERLQWEDASFDLILDKSTLDCLLCTDRATAGLLAEVYRVLKPGGVYLLISFHQKDFLQPLLSNLPGSDWEVSHSVMNREVEDLISSKQGTKTAFNPCLNYDNEDEPDYRRTLNVFQCRKQREVVTNHELDWDAVYHHVHFTNDQWFRVQNPMLSEERKDEIHSAFNGETLALEDAYKVIFTEAEREHLEYEGFIEDWKAFLESHSDAAADRVSSVVAIDFLDEMQ